MTKRRGQAAPSDWIDRVPYRGWYTVVIRDYDPGSSRIPVHRGLDTFRIYVY